MADPHLPKTKILGKETNMKNIELAKGYQEYIVSMRRYFHENPELSNREDSTIATISDELTKMGIEHEIIPHGGLLATIKGPAEKDTGRKVLLRADVDALPVQESDTVLGGLPRTVKSKNDGVMHACGHDGHIAMLLGAAKVLLDRKDEICGTVYLCFERGEEATGNAVFIYKYLYDKGIVPDSVYGTHLYSGLESGKLLINDTNMMSGGVMFDVTLEGRGGHGSRPDQSVSPIDAFRAIYQGLEGIRLRKVDPYDTLTYSVGFLHSGLQGNVIPDDCRFGGTARFFNTKGAGTVFYTEFKKLVERTADAYGVTAKFNMLSLPAEGTINDPTCARFAREVIAEDLGKDDVITGEPWMASESFSQYLQQWPGVFAFLGVKNDAKGVGAAHHNAFFDLDEDVLYKGSAAAVTYALNFLTDGPKLERKRSYPELYAAVARIGRLEMLRPTFGDLVDTLKP